MKGKSRKSKGGKKGSKGDDTSTKSCTSPKCTRPSSAPQIDAGLGSHLGCVHFPSVHDLVLLDEKGEKGKGKKGKGKGKRQHSQE